MNAPQMMRVDFTVKNGTYIFDITHRGLSKQIARDQKSVDEFLKQLEEKFGHHNQGSRDQVLKEMCRHAIVRET